MMIVWDEVLELKCYPPAHRLRWIRREIVEERRDPVYVVQLVADGQLDLIALQHASQFQEMESERESVVCWYSLP